MTFKNSDANLGQQYQLPDVEKEALKISQDIAGRTLTVKIKVI